MKKKSFFCNQITFNKNDPYLVIKTNMDCKKKTFYSPPPPPTLPVTNIFYSLPLLDMGQGPKAAFVGVSNATGNLNVNECHRIIIMELRRI